MASAKAVTPWPCEDNRFSTNKLNYDITSASCKKTAMQAQDHERCARTQSMLWTSCGGGGSSSGFDNNINGPSQSEEEAFSMASLVTSHGSTNEQSLLLPATPVPTCASGLSRNASFDSMHTHDSCTASFSTGSPVTVLPPLMYPCDNGVVAPSTAVSGSWTQSFNDRSCLEEQESIVQCADGFWIPHDDLMSDCDKLLASPAANFSSLLNDLPLRFDVCGDQACASNDYSVNDLDCLVQSSSAQSVEHHLSECHLTASSPMSIQVESHHHKHHQVLESPESVKNTTAHKVHPSAPDFCQAFLVGSDDSSDKDLSSDSAGYSHPVEPVRRRLSWSDQWPEQANRRDTLQFRNTLRASETTRSTLTTPLDHDAADAQYLSSNDSGGSPSHKRSYSSMQCESRSASSALATSKSVLKFSSTPNLKCGASNNQQYDQNDAAALSALLYKTQGSELIQQLTGTSSSDSARPVPPPKLRRRHGTATDPQSIAARTRRERFTDRIRILQSLVPNGERLDTVSMLGHTLEYVRFLQHQVWQLYNGNDNSSGSPDAECREKWREFMESQTLS